MRKPLMVAGVATLALGTAGIAYAQNPAPAPTSTATVSPGKAGTKAKPKAVKFKLVVKNNLESKTTASQIAVTFPSTLKLSTKGLKQCTASDDAITQNGPDAACPGTKAGSGEAHAQLNPYSATPAPLIFKVTPLVGKNEVLYYLEQTNGAVHAVLHGKISGRKMTIAIPAFLQQPAPGTFSALSDLTATLSLHKGKNALVTSTGCSGGKHKVGVVVSYVPNPTAPATSTASAPAEAKCSK